MRLFVGGHAWTVQGEPDDLAGDRCFTAARRFQARPVHLGDIRCLLDSGAFTDQPSRRLTPEAALQRQLDWERTAGERSECPDWLAEALVSYDLLIDETWGPDGRRKRRWSLRDADQAVRFTVDAAAYLAGQRDRLAPRSLVLACQGVDCRQYADCAAGVLASARPGDWLGLGGWCLLGRAKRLLPEFERTIAAVLPSARNAGLTHTHVFGVTYLPALGKLQWLVDALGMTCSTDSSAPVLSCTRGDPKKAGVRAAYWRDNVAWWTAAVSDAGLRGSAHYIEPRSDQSARQLTLWD